MICKCFRHKVETPTILRKGHHAWLGNHISGDRVDFRLIRLWLGHQRVVPGGANLLLRVPGALRREPDCGTPVSKNLTPSGGLTTGEKRSVASDALPGRNRVAGFFFTEASRFSGGLEGRQRILDQTSVQADVLQEGAPHVRGTRRRLRAFAELRRNFC